MKVLRTLSFIRKLIKRVAESIALAMILIILNHLKTLNG